MKPLPPTEPSSFANLSAEQIADWAPKYGLPNTPNHWELWAALVARCSGDISKSLDQLTSAQTENSKAAEALSRKLYWLNLILVVATVVGTVVAVATFLRPEN